MMNGAIVRGAMGFVCAGLACGAASGAAPRFRVFIDHPSVINSGADRISEVVDVSADGSVVVGSMWITGVGDCMFWWNEADGVHPFTHPTGGYVDDDSLSVSGDGLTIVGYVRGNGPTPPRGYRRTEAGGWELLSDPVSGLTLGQTDGVNHDGTVVVGSIRSGSTSVAARWIEGAGIEELGDLSGGAASSSAHAVNADGSAVVGNGTSAAGSEAFRWTATGGIVGLGDVPGGAVESGVRDVSADGSVVVGRSAYATFPTKYSSYSLYEAFRWTEDGLIEGLGLLPGPEANSMAVGASADGSVIVGDCGKAFIWTRELGMRSLEEVLVHSLGLDLGGIRLSHATAISDDGLTIVGWGENEYSQHVGWVATIPPPPCFNDVDGDRKTDVSDFVVLASNFATMSGAARSDGDLTGDGAVDSADFTALAGDFGCGTE